MDSFAGGASKLGQMAADLMDTAKLGAQGGIDARNQSSRIK
jgi:hypothetical protein